MSVDTLAIARTLRAVELPQEQAEAIAAAIGSAILESTATKADLLQLGTTMKSDMAQLRAELKADMEQLRSTMMMWFIGTILTLAALMTALIKL